MDKELEELIQKVAIADLKIWLYKTCEGRYLTDIVKTIEEYESIKFKKG